MDSTRYRAYLSRANQDALRDALWEPDIEPLPALVLRAGVGTHLAPEAIEPDEMLQRADAIQRERASHAAGDLLQPVSASFNIPWLEAIAGCPVVVHKDTLWAEHSGLSYEQLADLRLDAHNPWFAKLLACHRALCTHVARRYPVALPVMHGPLDIISALRGPDQFCLDLYDRFEALRAALDRLTDLWIEVGRALLDVTPRYMGGTCTRMHLWLPGAAVTSQADATSLMSSQDYRRYGLQSDQAIVEAFACSCYHIHSTSWHILDILADLPQLSAIQITLDPNGPPRARLRTLLEGLARRKPLLLCVWDRDWADWCLHELEPAGIAVALIVRGAADWDVFDDWMSSS